MSQPTRLLRVIVGRNLWGFLRGQFLSGLTVGILATLGLWIVSMPYPPVLGAMIGGLALVPMIGGLAGGLLAGAAGLVQGGWPLALKGLVVVLLAQLADSLLVAPRVQGRVYRVRPLQALGIVIFGGLLLSPILGPLAPLFALPITAMLRDALAYHRLRSGPDALSPEAALRALELAHALELSVPEAPDAGAAEPATSVTPPVGPSS